MQIKEPCVIDISHWNPVDWSNFDPRVVGVIMKVTESRDYKDPDCKKNFEEAGKLGLPRSLYHFFQPDDVAAQVDNFIEGATLVGAIVDGKWVAEIEPVLDAEYTPRTQTSVVGAKLAGQYKAWLDMVEARLGIRPIVYSSDNYLSFTNDPIYWTSWEEDGETKWGWLTKVTSKPPSWAGTYKLWTALYPSNPDFYNEPYRLPKGWPKYFLWQYGEFDGAIQGISGKTDLNVFNGSLEEWKKMYPVNGSTPPPTQKKYKVTCTANVNIRDKGGVPLGNVVGILKPSQTGYGVETMGSEAGEYYCLKVTSGADVVGWVYERYGWSNTYANIQEDGTVTPPPSGEKTFTITMTDDETGDVYSGKLTKV